MEAMQSTSRQVPWTQDEYDVDFAKDQTAHGIASKLSGGAGVQYAASSLRRAHTVAQGGNMTKRSMGLRTARDRTIASLLRVKDSHELLRQRSLKPSHTHGAPRDGPAGGREAKHFTVGNVGHNGRIYLRPIGNHPQKESRSPPFASTMVTPSPGGHLPPQGFGHVGNDYARWSNSQLSELRPEQIPEESCEDGDSVITESGPSEYPHRRRQRAHSFSTISEHQSVAASKHRGEFRIIIDRSDDRPKSAEGYRRPTLEVPIPHYRLGSPQFTTEGSAALRSSVYTRTSMSDQPRPSIFERGDFDSLSPLPNVCTGDSLQPGRPSFAASMFSGTAGIDLSRGSAATGTNPVFYKLKEPIEPSIFETLVSGMDDPSVVRYIPGTKDISAATPARIVAQISSESFMDYELVSDFFLTFRSYLSPNNLLSLLLARLEWAINRLQDDGRIIRIRTFAALRHWILNYFVDDFVTNYDLRVQFCETINKMYDDIKARENGGTSDLKILMDLKRCWHGRCSVYWDSPDLSSLYNNLDKAIVPGGITVEKVNSGIDEIYGSSQAVVVQTDIPTSTNGGLQLSNIGGDGQLPPSLQHDRTGSSATMKSIPVSTKSDQSVQVTSCSLPPRSPNRRSSPFPNGKAPHPVPLSPAKLLAASQEPQPLSPIIARRPPFSHAHKRSGSFSDSVRDDRAPLSLLKPDQQCESTLEILNPGSLIRGELYPPAESYMTMMAPPSPPLPTSVSNSGLDRRTTIMGAFKPTSSNSGVKTIIGSIRRVLHNRHGTQNISARTGNMASGPSTRGKTSALPTNIAFGSDLYRDRKTTTASRRAVRIDLLCDEVLKQYRIATGQHENKDAHGNPPTGRPLQVTVQEAESNIRPVSLQPPGPSRTRVPSQVTMGSESIVIVDDTGLDMPVMSGALAWTPSNGEQHSGLDEGNPAMTSKIISLHAHSQASTHAGDAYSLPIYYDESSSSLQAPEYSAPRRSYSVERSSTSRTRTSLSLRLRKYASFQSGISRHRLTMGSENIQSVAEVSTLQDELEKPAGPTLRRRPGGNLRIMQNIGDIDSHSGPRSFTSNNTTPRHSVASSTTTAHRDRVTIAGTAPPKFALIRTHSSQNLRPSFEAAIAQFAHIPDDDDGGIESTLLKLEGKWRRPSHRRAGEDVSGHANDRHNNTYYKEEQRWLAHHQYFNQNVAAGTDKLSRRRQTFLGGQLAYPSSQGRLAPHRPYSDSVAESEESYDSIPLLERGLSDESMKKPDLNRVTPTSAPRARLSGISSRDTSDLESSHPSIDVVRETESIRCIPRGSTLPVPPKQSEHRLSDLSSDLSVDVIDPREAIEGRQSTDMQSLGTSAPEFPPHPLAHPPSPPMTIQNPDSFTSGASPLNTVLYRSEPLTPDPSPTNRIVGRGNVRPIDMQQVSSDVLMNSERDCRQQCVQKMPEPDHVPFILACESQILAQQLTLVEKAALSEIDWRDLVEMRWSNSSPFTLNWVQFLVEEERRGIDLVVGRFNLMVKWVLSEIVLTQEIQERARTITKFIHTAVHAKRVCNYATMLQIAIALSSTDCTRLHKTWALVPPEDRRLFRDMESLIQPVRNFHDLRVEMETANLQEGCIPFVGLYVHDLTYNAQKPAQIASTRDGEALVNFERYRTAARIVKSLLRLIDASTKYNFEPVQGIIERCLWIASLSEEQIQARSKAME